MLADARCGVGVVRGVLDDPARSYDEPLWRRIAEQGWLGAAIPEQYNGLGLGRIELRKLRAADLDRFHTREAKCGKAPSTIRRYHSHIAAASAYLACVAGDLCSGGRPHTRYEVEAL